MVEPRHMTISPRHPRVLHPGPRVRIAEVVLVLKVIIVFAALFVAWILLQRSHPGAAAAAAGGGLLLVLQEVLRLRSMKSLRRLALEGMITQARVTSSRLTRFSIALRANRAMPSRGLPLCVALVVEYAFEDGAGRDRKGTFLTSHKDLQFYVSGRTHEVFYLEDVPETNVSSLVMRWYWKFGGPAMTDEAPEEDFPLDQDVIIEDLA